MDAIPLEYRILFIFAGIISFLLTERRFSFDMKQKAKMFAGYYIAVYVSMVIVYQIITSLINSG